MRRIRKVGEARICTSIIVAAELRYGAEEGRHDFAAQLEAVLGALDVLPFEAPADATYASFVLASNRRVDRFAATICSSRPRRLHSGIPSSRTMNGSSPESKAYLVRIGCRTPDEAFFDPGSCLSRPSPRADRLALLTTAPSYTWYNADTQRPYPHDIAPGK